MKKSTGILFISILLIGYCCQIGRFQTANHVYTKTHTSAKVFTKRLIACLNLRSETEKKYLFSKKSIKQKNGKSNWAHVSSASFTLTAKPNDSSFFHSNYFLTPVLFYSGKRGPPSLL